MRHHFLRVPALLGILIGGGPSLSTLAAVPHAKIEPAQMYVQWLRVDPRQPRTLFVGGTPKCADCRGSWAMRSVDGGSSWADLGKGLGLYDLGIGINIQCSLDISPFLVAADSVHIFADGYQACGSPGGNHSKLLYAGDGGLTWHTTLDDATYGGGVVALAASPNTPGRLYAAMVAVGQSECYGSSVIRSDTAAESFADTSGDPTTLAGHGDACSSVVSGLVVDPQRPDRVYANVLGSTSATAYAARSEDAGVTWTVVMTPTATPALKSFAVNTDPHAPGMLVGRTHEPGVSMDRIYLSGDHGRTWRPSACPGDLRGACPRFIVDNAFGAGRSYGFFADGLHAFRGSGSSGARLAISDHLPIPAQSLIDVGAGTHAGDPIYLLGKGTSSTVHGLLYRSGDGGASWQRLSAGTFPNVAPAGYASGMVYVRATRHSIGVAFVAAYRALGLQITGYPVTEPYLEGDVPTQDFEHLQLEVRNGKVVVGDLGIESFNYHDDGHPVSTDYVVAPKLMGFWQKHGGIAVLGAPIGDLYTNTNGDGSGRTYAMQNFEHARLELHPEAHDQHFAIQLGLLGAETLLDRGWEAERSP